MCGIFGLINNSSNKIALPMNFLHHRGPDHFGTFTSDSGIYLVHNRLSIIGLDKSSNQPMQGRDGIVIVFNGEIYNYKDLKKSELADYFFKSSSDTEVILALYEKYGVNCIDYLRGMFAFAIWDEKNKKLIESKITKLKNRWTPKMFNGIPVSYKRRFDLSQVLNKNMEPNQKRDAYKHYDSYQNPNFNTNNPF